MSFDSGQARFDLWRGETDDEFDDDEQVFVCDEPSFEFLACPLVAVWQSATSPGRLSVLREADVGRCVKSNDGGFWKLYDGGATGAALLKLSEWLRKP